MVTTTFGTTINRALNDQEKSAAPCASCSSVISKPCTGEASFLVLGGDALRDFENVRKIEMRVKQGEVLEL